MGLGLLGALGGLGKGLSDAGSLLFRDEIMKRREARLQAIRDKEYARGRADSLADYKMQRQDELSDYQTRRADQLSDLQSQREYQQGLVQDEREYNADAITQVMKGDDGELIGFDRSGNRMDLGTISVDDDTLSDYMRSFNSINAYLQTQGATADDPSFASDFQLRSSLMSSIINRLGGSTDNSAIIEEAMLDNPDKSRQEVESQLRIKGIIF